MIEETIKTFWKIDILVNNAWISSDVPIFERTAEQWKRTLDVNLIWTFLCSKYAILEMLKNKDWWKIINLASINGTKHFYPEQIDYDVSKAWIISLTKILAKASWPKISVNAIAPWNIDNYDEETPSWNPTEEDLNKIYSRRYWKITEIAKTVLFLASDNASFINGITLFLDWGCD
jgi:3-oxoacyl-[acyl-carrier protein] reductase